METSTLRYSWEDLWYNPEFIGRATLQGREWSAADKLIPSKHRRQTRLLTLSLSLFYGGLLDH
ncbi:unnamed protein product [Schistosoma mattheei]|uniref:Uncharacterized protein n=1 Tax=Schistosoma mattheei TaxID=31246 RepID=A0A183Q3P4_9TREM|nr:unnamed protein product [Schistosoma mattheei]